MPRKAPKEVIEHRLTLGDYERTQLVNVVNAYNRDKWLENVPNLISGIGVLGIAGSLGIAAYALYQWFDLPSLKSKISAAVQDTALDLGDLMAKYGFEPAGFRARMMARINTFDSEEEVSNYYNPIIEDLETALINAESAKEKASIESHIQAAKDARLKAYIQTGFRTGEGQQARQYSLAVLTSKLVGDYTAQQGGVPANSYIGGPGEQARIEFRDGLTAFLQEKVVELNQDAIAKGENYRYSYIGPTNADVTDPRPGSGMAAGQEIQFYKLNNQITRYTIQNQ